MKKILLYILLSGCASAPASSTTETIKVSEYKPQVAVARPTLYMFSADHCEDCQAAKAVVEHQARVHGNKVVIVGTHDPRLMRRLGYTSLPAFRFVRPGAPDLILQGWDEKRFMKAYALFDDGKH